MANGAAQATPFPVTTADFERIVEPLITPIHKVALVPVRNLHGDDPEVLLVQVKAKNPGQQDQVDFGLIKGTRQYRDPADGIMKDARTEKLARAYREHLEPLQETLFQEADTEAGIPRAALERSRLYDAGTQLFVSRKTTEWSEIQCYAFEAGAGFDHCLNPNPRDGHAVRWVPMSQLRAMEDDGKTNRAYVEAAERVVHGLRDQILKPAVFLPNPQATR